MKKNTFIPVFTFAFITIISWYSVYSNRMKIDNIMTEAGVDTQDFNMLSTASIYEQLLLITAIIATLYSLYKVVIFLKTGKEIDEDALINEKIKSHDRNFSKKTNTWIYIILSTLFVIYMAYLVIEMNVLT